MYAGYIQSNLISWINGLHEFILCELVDIQMTYLLNDSWRVDMQMIRFLIVRLFYLCEFRVMSKLTTLNVGSTTQTTMLSTSS